MLYQICIWYKWLKYNMCFTLTTVFCFSQCKLPVNYLDNQS